jgi:uncharacterized membrane protein
MNPEDLAELIPVDEDLTFGQRAADTVARIVGSWPFILGQTGLLIVWAILNVTAFMQHWDPYPFILMNLVLSLQAAFTAPMIMMAQNRQGAKDRNLAQRDLWINIRTGYDVHEIRAHLERQDRMVEMLLQLVQERHAQHTNGGTQECAQQGFSEGP